MEKAVKVFYFDRETGTNRDISDLDPAREENGESGLGWAGRVSGRVNAAVGPRGGERGRRGKSSASETQSKTPPPSQRVSRTWSARFTPSGQAAMLGPNAALLTGSVDIDGALEADYHCGPHDGTEVPSGIGRGT